MKVVKEGKEDKDTMENIDIGLLLWPFLHQTIFAQIID